MRRSRVSRPDQRSAHTRDTAPLLAPPAGRALGGPLMRALGVVVVLAVLESLVGAAPGPGFELEFDAAVSETNRQISAVKILTKRGDWEAATRKLIQVRLGAERGAASGAAWSRRAAPRPSRSRRPHRFGPRWTASRSSSRWPRPPRPPKRWTLGVLPLRAPCGRSRMAACGRQRRSWRRRRPPRPPPRPRRTTTRAYVGGVGRDPRSVCIHTRARGWMKGSVAMFRSFQPRRRRSSSPWRRRSSPPVATASPPSRTP